MRRGNQLTQAWAARRQGRGHPSLVAGAAGGHRPTGVAALVDSSVTGQPGGVAAGGEAVLASCADHTQKQEASYHASLHTS